MLKEQFKPEEIPEDTLILYEVSGFQDEFKDPQDFQDKYEDFFELGQDDQYIKIKNMNLMALAKENKSEYMRRVATRTVQKRGEQI